MKKILISLIVFILPALFYTESSLVVSGRVTIKGKGVAKAKVSISRINSQKSDTESNEQEIEIFTTTNSFGGYYFNLKPGKFKINCDYTPPAVVSEELYVTGPENFELLDKGIDDLNFKIVNGLEYVKANVKILSEISESIPAVNYKWGKVPLFSEDECKFKANGFLKTLKNEEVKDVLNGSSLGIPMKVYDIQGNIVFYQFPIINLDTRIGFIGVHALGIKPEVSNIFTYPSITLRELNNRIIDFKSKNFLMDGEASILKEIVALKLNINPEELMFKKILSLGPDSFSFYMVFNKFPGEENIIVDMNDKTILSSEKSKEQIQEESEARYTLKYILDMKRDN